MILAIVKLLLLQTTLTSSARILGLLSLPSPSHYIFNRALMVELAKRGHEVTVISPDKEKHPIPNYTNIVAEGVYEQLHTDFNYIEWAEGHQADILNMMLATGDWALDTCKILMKTEGVKRLMKYKGTFDLIIVESGYNECMLGFVHHFGSPPTMALSGIGIPPWTSQILGAPEFTSYIVDFGLTYDPHNMGLWEKLYNTYVHWTVLWDYLYNYIPKQDILARKYFGKDMPYIGDIARNISIALVNEGPGVDQTRPLPPAMIPIAGMHIPQKPNPLPQDLKAYLDEAKDGFIYFSLGSNFRSADMSENKRGAFIDAFRQIAPVRVLWKWEEESLPDQPENVRVGKWLPQGGILTHPNVRVFITHCGRMSTLETIYHWVPIVGMPFFWDQQVSNKKLQRKGVALHLDYYSATSKDILEALQQVLYNTSYRDNMKQLSAVFRDQPQQPLDRAVFWTEYMLRHGHKAANILKPASVNLSWYHYILLDVLLIVTVVSVSVFIMALQLVRCIWRILMGSTTKKTKTQ